MRFKTLEEIEALLKEMLVPTDVAGYLECDPYKINVQAQKAPDKLGFPVCVQGSRVKIPKAAFLFWARHGRPVIVLKGGDKIEST